MADTPFSIVFEVIVKDLEGNEIIVHRSAPIEKKDIYSLKLYDDLPPLRGKFGSHATIRFSGVIHGEDDIS